MNDWESSVGDAAEGACSSEARDEVSERAEAGGSRGGGSGSAMSMVMRIPVSMEVVLGRAQMPLSKLMKLSRGAIVTLDRKVGEVVDVVVNNRVVARGEVIVLDEAQSRFGVCLTEVASISAEDMDV